MTDKINTETKVLERIPLTPIESSRVYNFPKGETVTYKNVVAIYKNSGSTDRIETLNDGKTRIHIIKKDWLSIDIDTSSFTV